MPCAAGVRGALWTTFHPDTGRLQLALQQPGQLRQTRRKRLGTGPGITPVQQERLFTPFYTTKQNGTGLGLAVSWGIIPNHGGTIELESARGCGTCFTVKLPETG